MLIDACLHDKENGIASQGVAGALVKTTFLLTLVQEHVAQVALDEILAALKRHPSNCGVQEWGLKLLSTLTQVTPHLLRMHRHVVCCCYARDCVQDQLSAK